MARLRFRTAGESHGKGLLAILEGLPFGFPPDLAAVDAELARRQGGYGRSGRQKIERDRVEVLAGLKGGKTIGAPLALWVANRDVRIDAERPIRRPRPGHADLAGALRFETDDASAVMERASARETAARVAAGAVLRGFLGAVGIDVFGRVAAIGDATYPETTVHDRAARDASPFFGLDAATDRRATEIVDRAREAGDSVGGAFVVTATGVPAGLGTHEQWDLRLDGRLAQAVMSVPAVKAVAIGAGADAATLPGSSFHDPIVRADDGTLRRPTNRAGGLEGGMTDGAPVVVTGIMKAIPTLLKSLPSVDLATGEAAAATYERSDVCAVPAASVVAEAMVALVLADALLDAVGDVPWSRFPAVVEDLRRRRDGRRFGEPAGGVGGRGAPARRAPEAPPDATAERP